MTNGMRASGAVKRWRTDSDIGSGSCRGEPSPISRSKRIEVLAARERFRDRYAERRDPILNDRLLWRAQSFRHLTHILPGESILEVGCGDLGFHRHLLQVTRGENPIVAATFQAADRLTPGGSRSVEQVQLDDLPGALEGRQFDHVVGLDLLDARNSSWLLKEVFKLLKPGGQVVFYESNPWNPVLRFRRLVSRAFTGSDPRILLSRPQLHELFSDVGFVRISSVYNDFVYAPLTRGMIWFLRNLSIVLENAPGIRTLAGSLLVHGQKPPGVAFRSGGPLPVHESLRGGVSVVVPCHNEEMNVGPLIERLVELYGEYIHEIILVDDNSRDNTPEVIAQYAARDSRVRLFSRKPPNGVGRALADGYRIATGRWILSMDCDFQHLLPEFRDLFDAAAAGSPVVVGSRFSRLSVLLNYPFLKIVSNRSFHVLAQILLLKRTRDLTNNLKLIRKDVASRIEIREPGFAANAEVGLQPILMGHEVKEVPISWIDRQADMGSSSFQLARVGGGYGRVLWRTWLAKVFGRGPYSGIRSRPEAQSGATT